jgi:hypothetical protein
MEEHAARMITRLINYMGQIPPGSKIATDHYEEGRRISSALEKITVGAETYMYPWLNPGARKRPDRRQFEQLLGYLLKLETPMLLLVVPASLASLYGESSLEFFKLRSSFNFMASSGKGLFIIDSDGDEPVRVITV